MSVVGILPIIPFSLLPSTLDRHSSPPPAFRPLRALPPSLSSNFASENKFGSSPFNYSQFCSSRKGSSSHYLLLSTSFSREQICRAAEYKFPDPIPEFAEAETEKFRAHLLKKLPKKDIYGDSVEEVVKICTEILSTFLHNEYGGPGTLLVIPFMDMADTINERGLPGGPQAARAAVKWAQKHVDKDWNEWTGGESDQ